MPLSNTEPFRGYNFKLEIQGVTEGHFMECAGIEAEVTSIEHREAGSDNVVRKLPGPVKFGDVSLRYGLTDSKTLWDWFEMGVKGKHEPRNASVVIMSSDGADEVARWNLFNSWPSYWKSSKLDALGREIAIETIRLTFESMERAK